MRFAYADELAIGAAGEHLVCAELFALGCRPFRVESAPYDLGVDLGGERFVRLQVKSTREPRPFPQKRQKHVTGYVWTARRGKGATRAYSVGEVDGIACVALDVRQIAYLPWPWPQTFQIATRGNKTPARTFADYPFEGLL